MSSKFEIAIQNCICLFLQDEIVLALAGSSSFKIKLYVSHPNILRLLVVMVELVVE